MPKIRYVNDSGRQVPSVTTILGAVIAKPALVTWANRMGLAGVNISDRTNKAADVGTAVHEMIRHYLDPYGSANPEFPNTLSASDGDLVAESFAKFLNWYATMQVSVYRVEYSMVSEIGDYGGTADALVYNASYHQNEQLELWDFKTGNGIHDDYIYQLGAYCGLCSDHGLVVKRARIIRISTKSDEQVECRCLDESMLTLGRELFAKALDIYHIQQEITEYKKTGGW